MENDVFKKEIQQLILKKDYTNKKLKEKIKMIFEKNNFETIQYLYNISTGNGTFASFVGEIFLEKKDYINAYKYFKLSTRNDNFIGMLHLANLYERGLGVEKDIKKAIYILKFLETKIEHSKVYFKIGYFYEMGLGVEKNCEKAINYYKRALESGDKLSAYNLGMLFLKKGNKEVALKYLKRAEEFGYIQALNSLGRFYEEEKNYELAIDYYEKAAEQNSGNAFLNLGFIYEKGKGVEKNIDQAKIYYEKAIEQGNYKAKEVLSYLEGTDNKQLNSLLIDYEKNKSNMNYLFVLGTAYLNTKNYKKAIEYYKRSLGLGCERAKLQLAKAYFFNKDYEEAMELYHELEDTKNPIIYNSLAKIYTYWEDYNAALYCIQQSLKTSDDDRTKVLLIEIYIKMRDYIKAFEIFRTINVMTSKLKVLEIGVCINLKEYEKAIELINKEIHQKSNDWAYKPRLMLNKAFCYLKLNDFKKSKEIYENIMEFSDKLSQPYIESEKRITYLNIVKLKTELKSEEEVWVEKEIENIEEKLLIDESIKTELLDNKITEEEIITEKIKEENSENLLKQVVDEIIDIKTEKENFKRLELITEGKIEKSKSNDVIFYAVGGGDEIGASSYYLEIDGKKFLIDSGLRINPNEFGENYPRFSNLGVYPELRVHSIPNY
ncbi:MAG: tetratricopeptide repeat protein [Psychrilyobacter sp.]|uniref:SEL1-like repeat protein n=1 Tax=Psychrilyobacter sp. TaxID=2586924 RepID=UPI003C77423F